MIKKDDEPLKPYKPTITEVENTKDTHPRNDSWGKKAENDQKQKKEREVLNHWPFCYEPNPLELQGIPNRDHVNFNFYMINQVNPGLFCLVETRANQERILRFCKELGNNWKWAGIQSHGFSGGIITFWHLYMGDVIPTSMSRYVFHLVILFQERTRLIICPVCNSQAIAK